MNEFKLLATSDTMCSWLLSSGLEATKEQYIAWVRNANDLEVRLLLERRGLTKDFIDSIK